MNELKNKLVFLTKSRTTKTLIVLITYNVLEQLVNIPELSKYSELINIILAGMATYFRINVKVEQTVSGTVIEK